MQVAALGFFRMQAQAGSSGMFVLAIQLLGVILIVYFLFVRPQKKEQQRHREMVGALKKGDEVTTNAGIIGTIVKVMDDRLILQSGDARLVIERHRVASLASDESTEDS